PSLAFGSLRAACGRFLVALLRERRRVRGEARVRERRTHDRELALAAVDQQQVRQRLAVRARQPASDHLAQAGVIVVGRRLADPVAEVVALLGLADVAIVGAATRWG